MKSKYLPLATLFLIVLLAGVVFGSLWHAPALTWDDDSNIFNNPYYKAGWWLTFWESPYFGLYVPVTSWVWEAIYAIGGASAWPYRLLNLTLHLANVSLVYVLLRALARHWNLQESWPVVIGVALFAFHPLQAAPVAWISGGRDLLAAFFAFLAIGAYFRDTGWASFVFATVFFAASVLSKPNSVVLPAIVVLFDVFLRPEKLKVLLPRLSIWLLIGVWSVHMTLSAQADHLVEVPWIQRPWIVLDTFAFYARKLVLPWPLSGNYARTPEYVLSRPHTLGIGLAFLAAVALVNRLAWRLDRRFLVFWAWILALLPVSGIVVFGYQKISTPADHYNYMAMSALSALTMLAADRMALRHRALVYSFSLLWLVGLYGMTWQRSSVWRTDETFFRDMASYAPKSYSTAIGMSIVMCQDLKDYEAGVKWTEVALAARPNDILALANQAYCFLHAGNHFRVTELAFYLDRMNLRDLEGSQPTAYSSLLASIGTSYFELKEYEDGYQYLCEAYRVKPAEPNHGRNLKIASDIMRQQGLEPECETEFTVPTTPTPPDQNH